MDYAILFIFGIVLLFMTAEAYQKEWSWPVARGAVRATWPMVPEGFEDAISATPTRTLEQWLPAPETLTNTTNDSAPALYEIGLKLKNYDLLNGVLESKPCSRIGIGPTAQKCYNVDYAKTLELSSYAQRTNNYIHKNSESCSAPNHDLILNFYKA